MELFGFIATALGFMISDGRGLGIMRTNLLRCESKAAIGAMDRLDGLRNHGV